MIILRKHLENDIDVAFKNTVKSERVKGREQNNLYFDD